MSSGTSMPGSRSRYSLDLDDIIAFPDIAHVPVFGPKDGESWYILLEVTQNMSLGRPVFQVEDKLKGNFWMVAFYTDNPREDAKDVEVGSTICIRDGMPHQFLDGRMGYRIEDASSVIVLPCSMAILRTINQALRKRSDDGLLLCCVMCNKPVKRGCISCKTRYCSKECQKENWKTHKQVCKVLKTLHEWNRTDWG